MCGVPPSKKRAYGRNHRMSFRDSIVSTRVFTLIYSVHSVVIVSDPKSVLEIYKIYKL